MLPPPPSAPPPDPPSPPPPYREKTAGPPDYSSSNVTVYPTTYLHATSTVQRRTPPVAAPPAPPPLQIATPGYSQQPVMTVSTLQPGIQPMVVTTTRGNCKTCRIGSYREDASCAIIALIFWLSIGLFPLGCIFCCCIRYARVKRCVHCQTRDYGCMVTMMITFGILAFLGWCVGIAVLFLYFKMH